MRVLGVDVGASNTVGVVRHPDGRTRPLLFDGSPLLPSGVYLRPDGTLLVGRDAERHARLRPDRFVPHPTHLVADRVRLGGQELSAAELIGAVLWSVAGEARRSLGVDPDEVRLTCPVGWGRRGATVLRDAARRAGIAAPRLVPEPVAAATYLTAVLGARVPVGGSVAILDLGGGPFTATLVRRTATGFTVVDSRRVPFSGGLDLDEAVIESLGPTDRDRALYEDARGAKEMLSRLDAAGVHVPGRADDTLLTRVRLEQLIRPRLSRGARALTEVMAAAGPTRPVVFLVGGSARIPLVADLVRRATGIAPVLAEQPDLVIAEGAVLVATPPSPATADPPEAARSEAEPPWGPSYGPDPEEVAEETPPAGWPAYEPPPSYWQAARPPSGLPTQPYRPDPSSPLPGQRPGAGAQPSSDAYMSAPPHGGHSGGGPAPPEPAAVPTERNLVGELPSRVPVGREFSLIVEIKGAPATRGQRGFPFSLLVDRQGTPLFVIVRADPGLEILGDSEETVRVWPDRDSSPVRFGLRAHTAGRHTVRVSAWSGGTFLAEVRLQTSAAADRVHAGPRRVTAAMAAARPHGGEATLLVEVEGGRYAFRWLTEGFLSSRTLAEPLAGPPDVAVARTVETLRRIVEQESGYSASNARRWVTETGVGLWQDMVPDPIKDQFWQLRRKMRALYIACSDDWMPWELLYPRARHKDEGFLVHQLPVLRQVPDRRHPDVVRLDGAHCVVPPSSPTNATAEAAAVRRILLAAGVTGISDRDIDSLDDLLDMLDSGSAGLLHFACHNGYSVESGGSFIRMAGGHFVPALLNSIRTDAALARRNPLIFLNACRSAGIAPYYTRMMGWAEQFMSAGAGAFVGTLWPVETNRAAMFAETFYGALLAGDPLGVAGLRARRTIEDPADPSWLAYTIYGNPHAVAVRR